MDKAGEKNSKDRNYVVCEEKDDLLINYLIITIKTACMKPSIIQQKFKLKK